MKYLDELEDQDTPEELYEAFPKMFKLVVGVAVLLIAMVVYIAAHGLMD